VGHGLHPVFQSFLSRVSAAPVLVSGPGVIPTVSAFRPRWPLLPGLLLAAFFLQGFALPPPAVADRLSHPSLSFLAETPVAQFTGAETDDEAGSPAGLWAVLPGQGASGLLLPGKTLLRPRQAPMPAPGRSRDGTAALPRPPPAG